MPTSNNDEDDRSTSITVGVIRDLITRVDTFERNSSEERAAFKETIEASIVQLRKDFNAAITPINLHIYDHRKEHINDEKDRIDRQRTYDINFAQIRTIILMLAVLVIILTVLVVIGLTIIGIIIYRRSNA